ncbi:Tetratricopeptide repeat-containing protein [Desulfatibacillum alkenivorans DSM 16219]|jgi:tetratricopeptide (TPR) repeat protein|uniref:Tetratricopeptide repeat-containing protein n=1 Tax=Desulfatibacillum alkenivorans DSM 16219 TaxID=1121393 RepID=A0A1M6QBT1_9BACT|nr:tetratricopeptide repeat protein [Desulfatibacillum alkenivorans]SHK17533.1 Tetratricopeptide repeat-containing protein [Desulfatibacillum alkenivorans DSM 16219]
MGGKLDFRGWFARNAFLILFCLIMAGGMAYLFWPESRSAEDHLEDLEKKANYAYTVGNYDQAESLCREFLSESEKAYGLFHPNVAFALNNLALVLQAKNRPEEALPLLQRSLAINETAWGPNHRDVVKSLCNLALLMESMENNQEAARLFGKAAASAKAGLPPSDPLIPYIQDNLDRLNESDS